MVNQLRRNVFNLDLKREIVAAKCFWLWKPANIKVENNGAVVYVGSSLTVHSPLFFVHKLWLNKLMRCFYWSVQNERNAIESCARSAPKKLTKTYNKGVERSSEPFHFNNYQKTHFFFCLFCRDLNFHMILLPEYSGLLTEWSAFETVFAVLVLSGKLSITGHLTYI